MKLSIFEFQVFVLPSCRSGKFYLSIMFIRQKRIETKCVQSNDNKNTTERENHLYFCKMIIVVMQLVYHKKYRATNVHYENMPIQIY